MRPEELDILMPAAIAMFTEEVGVSPLRADGGAGYRARVSDLARWTAGIAAALRRGGVLLAYDEHPVAACLDQMLHWHESYFDAWPVSRVVEALLGAGLGLERLEELPDPNRWGRREVRVPGDLVVIARKP